MSDDELLAMRELVRALERAEQGEVSLDLRISGVLDISGPGQASAGDSMLLSELAPETVDVIVGEVAVPFTRSIDAALPGENIVLSMYSKRRDKWVAVHRGEDGSESVAWASTEPLARRAAALRGGGEDATAGRAGPSGVVDGIREVDAEGDGAGRRAENGDAAAGGGESVAAHTEWKIGF